MLRDLTSTELVEIYCDFSAAYLDPRCPMAFRTILERYCDQLSDDISAQRQREGAGGQNHGQSGASRYP
jgi:hypothetical protein